MESSEDRRKAAIGRLKAKQEFKKSLVAYLAVNGLLVAIWALGDGGGFWPIWPILGWGLAIVLQGWNAYFRNPISERDIEREIEKGS